MSASFNKEDISGMSGEENSRGGNARQADIKTHSASLHRAETLQKCRRKKEITRTQFLKILSNFQKKKKIFL